jgi:hypothetical protein
MRRRLAPSEKSERFYREAAEEMLRFQAQSAGVTEEEEEEEEKKKKAEERRKLKRLAQWKADNWRLALWTRWLRLESWTIQQAAYLLEGRDPDQAYNGSERYHEGIKRLSKQLARRVLALADEHLKPVSRVRGVRAPRYRPSELIALAERQKLGHAEKLKALADEVPESERPKARISVECQRAELVVAFAQELITQGTGFLKEGNIHLPMQSSEFFDRLVKAKGVSARRLVENKSPPVLERSRLDRAQFPDLAKVFFAPGKPRG